MSKGPAVPWIFRETALGSKKLSGPVPVPIPFELVPVPVPVELVAVS